MKINRTEFVISAMGPDQYPEDGLPEIALAGRSNVGKSSMINCLINRKNLARRSATPGKTQSLNYYRINAELGLNSDVSHASDPSVNSDDVTNLDAPLHTSMNEKLELPTNSDLFFVDFPGYGYAKVSKTLRVQWGKMIEHYLQNREVLKLVLLVIDLRHPPSQDDQAMYSWLHHYDVPRCVVATKADKIPKGRWDKHRKIVKQTLHLDSADPLIMFSSESGLGREQLWALIKANMD